MTSSQLVAAFKFMILVAAATAVVAAPRAAFATHHLWKFSEVFSTADGSIQFIELATTSPGQNFIQGVEISSQTNTFTFPSNIVGSTANRSLLLGTRAFAALPNVPAPNFIIPEQFFDPNSGVTEVFVYGQGADIWTLSSNSVPTDCINSLHRVMPGGATFTAPSTPTNFAGETTTGVDVCAAACPADLFPVGPGNGDGIVGPGDLGQLLSKWGRCAAPCPADVFPVGEPDAVVGPGDLGQLLSKWGQCE